MPLYPTSPVVDGLTPYVCYVIPVLLFDGPLPVLLHHYWLVRVVHLMFQEIPDLLTLGKVRPAYVLMALL